MKILYITQFLPFPANTGGKIKTYQTLELISQKHQIFLISFVEKKSDLKWESKFSRFCYGRKTFVTPIISTSYKNLKLKVLLSFFNPKPFRLQKYFLKETADYIRRLSQKENFDIIFCCHDTSTQYLPYVDNWQAKLKIYDGHDITSQGFFSYLKFEKRALEKIAYFIEGVKYFYYEKKIIKLFDKFLTISREDRQDLIKRGVPKENIYYLPTPFKANPIFRFGQKNILFMGLLSWWPNRDAIFWFYKNVYPKIKKKIPEVKLFIVGANPDKEIIKLAGNDPSVVLTGQVKDTLPYLKKAGVFVVPVRAGSGIRIKVLEVLSRGLPVASTGFGLKGLGLENEIHALVADTPDEFCSSVCRILLNKELSLRLSRQGNCFIKDNYTVRKSKNVLKEVLDEN